MPGKIKILIIDDEAPARDLVRNYLSAFPEAEILAECENGFDALRAIQEMKPDLLFLDIQMPKITGFELLEVIDAPPAVIFTTAYDQYAIRAFEMNAVDYLLKPFSRNRFAQAFRKALNRIETQSGEPDKGVENLKNTLGEEETELERVVARIGSKIVVIPVDKIYYIEAQDDYVMIHSELGNHLKEKTMKYFAAHLPTGNFLQIHRSYIVNMNYISSVELYEKNTHLVTLKNGARLRTSQEGYKRLREVMK